MSVMPVSPRKAIIMPVRGRATLTMTVSRSRVQMRVAPGAAAAHNSSLAAAVSAAEAAASAVLAEASEDGVAADAAAAAASAAAALVSENNAETAETNAETAQAAAEAARDAALIAETNAETAETNAETAASTATTQAGIATTQAGLAATSATNAQTAETNAETAETNAEAAQAAAEAAAASLNLPIIAPGDAGKTLVVKVTEDGYELDTAAAGLADGDYGDFTVSSGGTVATIDNGAVTYAKMQDVSATARLIGRKTAGSGDPEELTLTEALDLVGSAAEGDILYRGASAWARLPKGTAFQHLRQNSALTAPEWATDREVLTANRTYYVRTDGSDSNTGLVDSSGGAFLTLQKAFNVIQSNLDVAGYTVTIQKDANTHTAGLSLGNWVGGGTVSLHGGGGTISTTSAMAITASGSLGGLFTYSNVTLVTTTGGNCVNHGASGTMSQGASVVFGACAGNGHIVIAAPGAFWSSSTSYSITGGAARHYFVSAPGGYLLYQSGTITLTGTPAFTIFAQGNAVSRLYHAGTFSGSATGQRYNASENASINTGGGGANYFPGNSAGAVSTGGLYA